MKLRSKILAGFATIICLSLTVGTALASYQPYDYPEEAV